MKKTSLFGQECVINTTLLALHSHIIEEKDESASFSPVIAIDVSVLQLKKTARYLHKFYIRQEVPVTEVFDYTMERCSLLNYYKFMPIVIFDGQRCPCKYTANKTLA